jgi:hypothetical protein
MTALMEETVRELSGLDINFLTTNPSGKCKVKSGCPKEICYFLFCYNVLIISKIVKYLVVRRTSWHEYLLALQSDLVVPGKRTILSVEPCRNG